MHPEDWAEENFLRRKRRAPLAPWWVPCTPLFNSCWPDYHSRRLPNALFLKIFFPWTMLTPSPINDVESVSCVQIPETLIWLEEMLCKDGSKAWGLHGWHPRASAPPSWARSPGSFHRTSGEHRGTLWRVWREGYPSGQVWPGGESGWAFYLL